MKTQITLLNLIIGTAIASCALFQIGCHGGGFTSQDAVRAKETGKTTATEAPTGEEPAIPPVPEIINPEEGETATQPPTEPEEPVVDDSGQVVTPTEVCSEEYRQKHNEIYELMLKLAAYKQSEKTKEQTEQGIAVLRESDQKCKEFALRYAQHSCKAKLKSSTEPVVASYKELLQKACESVAEGVQKLNAVAPAGEDPAVDPTQEISVLTQDLTTLMKNQILEIQIKDSSALLAGSNKEDEIEVVWMDGKTEKKSLEAAAKSAVENKQNYCAVFGYVEITGAGTITHRAVSTSNLDPVNGLIGVRIEMVSYLSGMGAEDQSNVWVVSCFGSAETFQPTLASVSKTMGSVLTAEIVGPVQ